MWILLFVLALAGVIGVAVWKRTHSAQVETKVTKARRTASDRGESLTEERAEEFRAQHEFPIPKFATTGLAVAALTFLGLGMWNEVFFYAEPGYKYHVRTILGTEKAVDNVGYSMYLFGRYTPWKKAMSIVSKAQYAGTDEDDTDAGQGESSSASVSLGPVRTIFLDQVDAQVSATARFLLPVDEESFLVIARQYRTPENLLRTTLLPSFQETLQANAALMGAEDYFAGGRTQFNVDFEDQLKNGLFLVKRNEVVVSQVTANMGTANASLEDQETFGNDEKVVFIVEKLLDGSGVPIRKVQSFKDMGITVIESRITDVVPNTEFADRMKLKQKASADRAIAREQRIQEEEQRLLAEATGDRQVAEKKAEALVKQIELTTDAETTKQLAITKANQQMEAADIDRQRSEILLVKAEIDAQAVVVAADAEAYRKEAIIKADNALAQKLDTEIAIQKVWAEAYAKRAVPQYVFGGGGGANGTPVGSDSEGQLFMQLMSARAAKELAYDRSLTPEK